MADGGRSAPASDDDGRPLVLIVDDEAPIAEALAMVVEDAGYQAVMATNGQDGLKLALARRPALIMTDMMMPRLDGAGLIAAVRDTAAQNGHAPPAIVVMTAGGLQSARAAEADLVLRKPFDLAEIEALLRRFLEPPSSAGR